MKRILFAFLLFTAFAGKAQVIQKVNTHGFEYKRLLVDSFLRPALDTLPAAPDGSIAFVNHAYFVKDTLWKLLVNPIGSSAIWGTILGDINDQTDLQTALNLRVPKTTALTINGVTQDLSANRSWGPFLAPDDTLNLYNQIVNIYSILGTTSGGSGGPVTFQQALINGKVMTQNNDVTGAYRMGFGTATSQISQFTVYSALGNILSSPSSNTIQSVAGTNNITSSALILEGTSSFKFSGIAQTTVDDTTTYKPVVIDASGNVRQSHWNGSGGTTPNLQAVTTAGATTTNSITVQDASNVDAVTIYSPSTGKGQIALNGNSAYAFIRTQTLSANRSVYLPNENTTDTLATLADVRGVGGSTYSAGFGLNLTSTTFKVDTSLITTNAHLYKVADSLGALIGGGSTPPITSTQIAFGNSSNIMTSSPQFRFDSSTIEFTLGNHTASSGGEPRITMDGGVNASSYWLIKANTNVQWAILSSYNDGFYINRYNTSGSYQGTGFSIQQSNGLITLGYTPNYTDNAAALAGGLVAGQVYRNGDVLMIVH